jgi:hypothetical protein
MKQIYSLAVIALGLCFSTIGVNYADSSELIDNDLTEILLSQLRGHDIYDNEPQMKWDNYSLGRVVGKSGGIMSILVEDGTSFQADGYVRPGSDVLVAQDENGEYYLVSASHSEWISYLEEDYGVKRNKNYPVPLLERTAPIWAEIEAGSSRSVLEIPEREPVESQYEMTEPTMMEESEPVRGLW